MNPAESSLKIGIFGAEPWTGAMRSEIEERAGIDAVDIYGLSEVMGPGVACECVESKDGPVIWEDHFYPEIIDPVTGEVLPDGSPGELVFTSLSKEAMPIIRYRTRDLTALLPPTSRAMRRMAKITGRSDDMMIVRGVNVFPSQIEELILAMPKLSPQYQLTLLRDGHLDSLAVRVEARAELCESLGDGDRGALARELQHRIKTMVGVSTSVSILRTGEIPVSATGKAKRVIDLRNTPKA
jgi:phenylacetate-CoA ligase